MPDQDDTFTRIMVALAVSDAPEMPPTREIEQMADELIEWRHRLKEEFLRAKIADQIAKLTRTQMEAQLASRLASTACCLRRASANDADPASLSDDDLRERLVDAEAFVERMAA